MDQMLQEIVAQLGKTQKVYEPTEQQEKVIVHPLFEADGVTARPLLVVAGAGSGKTETMSMRAVYVARRYGIEPQEILGLTFTKKAAGELRTRLTQRFDALQSEGNELGLRGANIVQASTYNAFAQGIVQEFGARIGVNNTGPLLNQAAGWQLMYDVIKGWKKPLGDRSLTATVDAALSLREDIANQGMTLDKTRKRLIKLREQFQTRRAEGKSFPAFLVNGESTNEERLALLEVIEAFEEQKNALGRLDFADQVTFAWKIVQEDPNVAQVLRERHKVVFLDEFQDTSYAQLKFLSALFGNHPTTAVGDPHQAIYAWRGGSAASLDDFHRLFSSESRRADDTLSLMTAWRNDGCILRVANAITASSPKQAVEVPSLEPRKAPKGEEIPEGKKIPEGEVFTRYELSFPEQMKQLVDFLQQSGTASDSKRSQAVLCRRGTPIPRIVEALQEAGINAQTNVGEGVLFHPAVVDLRAALEATADLGKSSEVMRLVYGLDFSAADLWGVGQLAKKLRKERSLDHDAIWVEVLEYIHTCVQNADRTALSGLRAESVDRLVHLNSQLRSIRKQNGRTVVEQVEHARRVLGLDQQAAATGKAESTAAALDYFTQVAADFEEADPTGRLQDFLLWLRAAETKERGLALPSMTADPGAVQVMTIHAAKGLEWDDVAVVDMETGVFPVSGGPRIKFQDQQPIPPYNFDCQQPREEGKEQSEEREPGPKAGGWWQKPGVLPFPVREDHAHLPQTDMVWDPDKKAGETEEYFRLKMGLYALTEERNIAYVAFTRPRHRLLIMGSWLSSTYSLSYPSMFLKEAVRVQGVQSTYAPFPTEEEQEVLKQRNTEVLFPPRPGSERKLVQYTAQAVRDEIGQLRRERDENRTEEALWVGVDKELRVRVNALLEAVSENEQQYLLARQDPRWKAVAQLLQDRQRLGQEILPAQAASVARKLVGQLRQAQEQTNYATTALASALTDPQYWLNLRRPVPGEPSQQASVGTAFHQWVEQYLRRVCANDSEVRETSTPLLDASSGHLLVEDQELSARLEAMKEAFIAANISEQYQVQALEAPFSAEIEGLLIRGRIDACLQDRSTMRTLLVDWKTGNPQVGSDLDQIERYLVQLDVYRQAWKQIHGVVPEAALYFVRPNGVSIVTLEDLEAKFFESSGQQWDLATAIERLRVSAQD